MNIVCFWQVSGYVVRRDLTELMCFIRKHDSQPSYIDERGIGYFFAFQAQELDQKEMDYLLSINQLEDLVIIDDEGSKHTFEYDEWIKVCAPTA